MLAEVEATLAELPAAILNEIRSYNDHISRCYWDSATPESNANNIVKAESHLKRAVFDCIKHLLVFYTVECKKFDRQTRNIDLTLVADGTFYQEYRMMRSQAIALNKKAKIIESQDPEKAFDTFQDAFNTWCALFSRIEENTPAINRARLKSRGMMVLTVLLWLLAAVASGVISTLLGLQPVFQALANSK